MEALPGMGKRGYRTDSLPEKAMVWQKAREAAGPPVRGGAGGSK